MDRQHIASGSRLVLVFSSSRLPVARWRGLVGVKYYKPVQVNSSVSLSEASPYVKDKEFQERQLSRCKFRAFSFQHVIQTRPHSRVVNDYLEMFFSKQFRKIFEQAQELEDCWLTSFFLLHPLTESLTPTPLLAPLKLKPSHAQSFEDLVQSIFNAFLIRGKEAKHIFQKNERLTQVDALSQFELHPAEELFENMSPNQLCCYKTSISTIIATQETCQSTFRAFQHLNTIIQVDLIKGLENGQEIPRNMCQNSLTGIIHDEKFCSSQSQFHNLKNSFMHLLIQLFNSEVLDCFAIPKSWTEEVIRIIERMRNYSVKYRPVKGTYQYYSNAHYSTLFQRITDESLKQIQQIEQTYMFHQQFFCENILTSRSTATPVITRCNFFKELISNIVMFSIEKIEFHFANSQQSLNQSNRFSYIAKVKKGIQKFRMGKQVIRF